jgi:hypothetical protein
MAGEQRDVRADQRLDEVEHFIGEEPVEEFGVREMRHVHRLRTHVRRQPRDFLLKMLSE